MKISIIIPVLNEAENIKKYLQPLQFIRSLFHEIILVDGGSEDRTLEYAEGLCSEGVVDKLCQSPKGRAIQQNFGAKQSSGDVLLFLHGDTCLPQKALESLNKIRLDDNLWGRFNIRLSSQHWLFRIIEFFMNHRSCLTGIATGDQTIFVRKDLFDKIGGFPEIPLMEDIEVSRLLRKYNRPVCIKDIVISSSRRWENNGILLTILKMWWYRLSYFFGVSADTLVKKYYQN